jgi:hypothetical protein
VSKTWQCCSREVDDVVVEHLLDNLTGYSFDNDSGDDDEGDAVVTTHGLVVEDETENKVDGEFERKSVEERRLHDR